MAFEETPKFKSTDIGLIPQDWELKKLKELGNPKEVVLTGPFGSLLHSSDYSIEGVPLVLAGSMENGKLSGREIPKVNFKKANELKRFFLREGDIVFVRVGVGIGDTIYVEENMAGWLFSGQTLRIRLNNPEVNNRFVEYYFRSGFAKKVSETTALGSTRPSANTSILENRLVPLPPLVEQKKIEKFIFCLESKIALNKKMNKTLEDIGKTIFNRWFVDFEFPNEKGKPYKSSSGEMVNSAVEKILSGWEIGGLSDICDITMGQSPPGETYNETDEGVPFFQGVRDFGFRFPSKRIYCTAPTRFAQVGDVLLSVRAPVGNLNVAEQRCAIGRGVASLRLKGKQHGFLYYLLLATNSGWEKYESEGTVFGSATKQDVYDFKIVIPSKNLRDQFGELIEPLDKRILLNEMESRNLTAIRDSLLPRLMSGKIRVPIPKENAEVQ